jgi:hypothetical protein
MIEYFQEISYILYFCGCLVSCILLTSIVRSISRSQIKGEILRNKKLVQSLWYVYRENCKRTDQDHIGSYNHSLGFLMKSIDDIKNDMVLKHFYVYRNTPQEIDVKNIYKAFDVVKDVLKFLDKINTDEEILDFIFKLESSSQLAVDLCDKFLLPAKREVKK